IVVDPVTGEAWSNPPGGLYESVTSDNARIWYFAYPVTDSIGRANLIDLLTNEIPEGHYVNLFSIDKSSGEMAGNTWAIDSVELGTNIFSVLEKEGVQNIRDLENGDKTFLITYKKGEGLIDELYAEEDQRIEVESALPSKWGAGVIQSTVIGPAESWNKVEWQLDEVNAADSSFLNIHIVNPNGTLTLFESGIEANEFSLDSLDAGLHPYIMLELVTSDLSERSAPQLDYWRVFYESVNTTSVNEIETLDAFVTYPNPTYDQINIAFDLEQHETLQISLHNLNGQKIANLREGLFMAGNYTESFNMSHLPAGNYIIQIQSENKSAVSKIIKL
ncbi:MAG: T9SS type A sorting domain-containing protein, partial [Bacteroidota bacterium]